jgi:hypothetical protein
MSFGGRQYFRSMAGGGAFALLGKLIAYPLGLLLAIVLARLLSPAELGGYLLAVSLVLIAAVFSRPPQHLADEHGDKPGIGAAPGRECANADGFPVRAQDTLQQR